MYINTCRHAMQEKRFSFITTKYEVINIKIKIKKKKKKKKKKRLYRKKQEL